ncbi:MAG: hypothetical protein HFI72_04120 [Peptococcaceae bacterium]|nr:hypothetical protein [Peptococcaceae bacterium]
MMRKILNKQQVHKTVLVLFWCCSLLFFCSCSQKPAPPENQDTPLQRETKEISLLELPQETDLLYLGREGDFDYFIDPVLPGQEIKVAVDKRASQFLTKVHPFSMLQVIYDSNNPQGIPEMRIYSLSSINTHFFCGVETPPGTAEEIVYGKEFLNSFLFTRLFPAFAISDYQLLEAKLTPLDEKNHMFMLSLSANLIPEKTEFHKLGYKWSGYQEQNDTITGQQLTTMLYHYDGKWGCYYNSEDNTPLTDGYKKNPIVPEMEYSYQVEDSNFDDVFEGKPVQAVFYEDGNYSYLTQTIFVITEKSQDASTIESGYFRTQLLQYERETGYQREMTILSDNLLFPKVIARNQNLIYLATSRTEYPSGEMPGNISRLDAESGKVEDLFLDATPLLATAGEIFVLQLGETTSYSPGIYVIHIADGGIERLSNLPGPGYSTEHEAAFLTRKITQAAGENNQEVTYLYLLWPCSDYTRQDFYDGFVINTRTSEITTIN